MFGTKTDKEQMVAVCWVVLKFQQFPRDAAAFNKDAFNLLPVVSQETDRDGDWIILVHTQILSSWDPDGVSFYAASFTIQIHQRNELEKGL